MELRQTFATLEVCWLPLYEFRKASNLLSADTHFYDDWTNGTASFALSCSSAKVSGFAAYFTADGYVEIRTFAQSQTCALEHGVGSFEAIESMGP